MFGSEFFLHDHVSSRSAKISCLAFVFTISSEELDFERSWEILLEFHGRWRFAVNHDPAVSNCPSWTAFDLLASEAIF